MTSRVSTGIALLAAAGLLVTLSGCAQEAQLEEGHVELIFSHTMSPDHSSAQADQAWMDAVTEATDGEVTFNAIWNGGLCAEDEVSRCVSDGIADLAVFSPSYNPAAYPLGNISSVGFVSQDITAIALALNEMYARHDQLRREYENQNQKSLYYAPFDLPVIASTSPGLSQVTELRGERIRATGSYIGALQGVRAAPVTVDLAEIYEGLERGVLDGAAIAMPGARDLQLGEVATSVYDVSDQVGSYLSLQVIMNLDAWNRLTPEQQEAIDTVTAEHVRTRAKEFLIPGTEDACRYFEDSDVEMTILEGGDDARDWVESVGGQQRQSWETASGLDDAGAFFDEYLGLISDHETDDGGQTPLEICRGAQEG